MGSPAIYARNVNSRGTEFSADLLNPSVLLTEIAPSANGGSESCNTSDKDSATPPQDPHRTSDLLGVLPKIQLTERLRRTHDPFKISDQHEQNMAYGIPNGFNVPALLPQSVQHDPKVKAQQNPQSEIISTGGDGQPSSLKLPLQDQPPFMQPISSGSQMQKNPLGLFAGAADDGAFSNWTMGSLEDSIYAGYTGFNPSLQEGEDINSLLNEAAWDDPI